MVLPICSETTWIWTGSFVFFARVCKLRLDPHAQKETREIAKEISKHLADLFPVSWAALLA
jgi:thymidylate synthase (FAD)